MTAAEVYDSVTNGGATDFAEVVAILDQHGPWCLIGGLAVNHYVEPVYTIDADVILVTKNLEAVRCALVNATRPQSKLSLQFTVADRYQSFIARAQRGEVLGCLVPIASLPDLVQGKIWAWSDPTRRLSKHKKDELDLIRIAEAFPQYRSLMPVEITAQIDA